MKELTLHHTTFNVLEKKSRGDSAGKKLFCPFPTMFSLIADYCFNKGYVGKQPISWGEYSAKQLTLKECPYRYNDIRYMTNTVLKEALKSYNQPTRQTLCVCVFFKGGGGANKRGKLGPIYRGKKFK